MRGSQIADIWASYQIVMIVTQLFWEAIFVAFFNVYIALPNAVSKSFHTADQKQKQLIDWFVDSFTYSLIYSDFILNVLKATVRFR